MIRRIGGGVFFGAASLQKRFLIFCDLSCDFAFKVSKVYPKELRIIADSETDEKNVKKLQTFQKISVCC
jgi:hypothetical protein